MTHKYALRYTPHLEHRAEGYSKEDAGNSGLCDAFLGISILYPEDGSYSQAIVIADHGKEKRCLSPDDIFKIWMTLGLSLHDEGMLEGWKAQIVAMHTDTIRELFRNFKNES